MGERIGGIEVLARGEEEKRRAHAVWYAQVAQRVHHGLHAVLVGRDGKDAEGLPAEVPFVLLAACAVR